MRRPLSEPRVHCQNAVHPGSLSLRRNHAHSRVEGALAGGHSPSRVGSGKSLKISNKIAVGVGVFLMGGALVAMRPHRADEQSAAHLSQAHLKLAAVSTAARRDVDYQLLDSRL